MNSEIAKHGSCMAKFHGQWGVNWDNSENSPDLWNSKAWIETSDSVSCYEAGGFIKSNIWNTSNCIATWFEYKCSMITYSKGLWLRLVVLEMIVRQRWHVKLDGYQVGYKKLCSTSQKIVLLAALMHLRDPT